MIETALLHYVARQPLADDVGKPTRVDRMLRQQSKRLDVEDEAGRLSRSPRLLSAVPRLFCVLSPPTPDHAAWVRGTLVRTLWRFLQQEKNRQLLGWLGGGVVILAGGLWAAVTFFYSPHPALQTPDVNVEAPGGVAAGRDIRGSTITVQPTAPPADSSSTPDPRTGR
jgi:hypothetical protein